MTLAAGSIAFTGFNADGNDSLAFVALENLVSGTIIYFGDNEWNGLAIGAGGAFNTGEGAIALTLTANVAAGTIVTLNDLSVATRNSNFGTVTGSVALGNSNETVYAYLGSSATTPTTFLAAITNSTFAVADGQLAGTGLTAGTDAIALSPGSPDVAVFTGARTGLASFAAYRSSINNAANWITQDGSGDQSIDNIAPDVPFSAAAFTLAGGNANASISINNVAITEGNSGTSLLTFTVTRTDNSGAFSVDFASSDGTAQAPGDYVAATGTINFTAGGALTQTISVTVNGDTTGEVNETLNVTLSNLVNTSGTATIADGLGVGTISNDDVSITAINAIQGATHISPLLGLTVTTTGIVTAVDSNGFYLQTRDADIDASIATSEAIFVFTSSAPAVAVGDAVNVTGTVGEFTPGGASTGNLSTTQLSSPTTTILSSGNALPTAILLGVGGRVLPTANIDNDGLASFDPTTDGVDFYESLEAMRVTVPTPRAVSASNSFGEIYTVANNGAGATGLSTRGTIVTQGSVGNGLNLTNTGAGSDYNPERIQIDADSTITPGGMPLVDVGAVLNDITGVIGYNFGNFEVIPTTAITVSTPSILTAETTSLNGAGSVLTIASYNVLNLDPNDTDIDTDIADGRFISIANQIVFNLNTPDIIALQEVQDNSGSTNDGTVSASITLQTLVDAISAAGGPVYNFVDNSFITNNTNGGEPGGNIRVAYLYDASRVTLVSTSTTPNAAIDFAGSRPPLVANFSFGNETITVIDNHFTSKGGGSPLYGVNQPSLNGGAAERLTQATNVANFVASLGASAKVVVLGDLNEFTNEESLAPLSTAGLMPMSLTLAATERYSYIFEGNAQELDQVYLSGNLSTAATFDIVHTNTEFASTSASDHDPSVLAINFAAPAQSIGGIIVYNDAASLAGTVATPVASNDLVLVRLGSILGAPAGAESIAFEAGKAYSSNLNANTVDVTNVSASGTLSNEAPISLSGLTQYRPGGVNGVAVKNGIVAVGYENITAGAPGYVALFDAVTKTLIKTIQVGVLPDQLAFSPDGLKLLVANEGETVSTTNNPVGSISIISLAGGAANASVTNTIAFDALNGFEATLRARGLATLNGQTAAADIEPEYISVSADGTRAYVTLQEVNAVAVIDLTNPAADRPLSIQPLGSIDRNLSGNALDTSDQDGPAIALRNVNIFSLPQPDAIASYSVGGVTYFVTANEGDSRVVFTDSVRLNSAGYVLDPTLFPNAAALKANANLGRLNVLTNVGDTDGDGDFDKIFTLGGRSISIFRQEADGSITKVRETGGEFEAIIARDFPAIFNSNQSTAANSFDTRSDDKGPEPEGVTIGTVNGRIYAFVGLERVGGQMVYDITDPANAVFVTYRPQTAQDIGPETSAFVAASDSPTGQALLLAAQETTNTVTLYSIQTQSEGDDTIIGGNDSESWSGRGGSDSIQGNGGNDNINGGSGTDTAVYNGGWVGYDVTNGGATVIDIFLGNGNDGTDTLTSVELLRFSGVTVAAADAVNDAPIGVDDTNAGDALTEDGDSSAAGNVLTNDTDADAALGLGETKTVTGARTGTEAGGGTLAAVAGATIIDGVYGQLTINPDGSYSYALDNVRAVTQALQAGQVATESFTYRVADAHGLVDTAQLDLAITGAYDTGDTLIGTADADSIDGTSVGETIVGLAGDDVINALGGDDMLNGGPGGDRLNGGEGNDTVTYATAASAVSASLSSNSGSFGEALGDRFSSIENLLGSAFDDTLIGNLASNTIEGGLGNDVLDGGAGGGGADTVSYERAQAAVTVSLALQGAAQNTGAAGNDTLLNFENLTGSAFDDMLAGDDSRNVLDGGAGIDTLTYAAASAGVSVNLAVATLQSTGGSNLDTIRNFENLTGSAFNDTLGGDAGDNRLDGGAGSDTITYARATSGVTVSLALQGAAQATGSGGNDTLINFENLTGSAFDDVLAGNAGDNAIDGGLGVDTLSYAGASAGVTVNLALTTAQDTGGAGIDTIKGIENLLGSAFNDVLTGNWQANAIDGGNGDDSLDGGLGNDILDGGDGDDLLIGGRGSDVLRGGAGIDTASYIGGPGATVDLMLDGPQDTGLGQFDTLIDIENLVGSSGNDTLAGNAGDNRLDGAGGTDTVSYERALAAVTVSLGLQGAAQNTLGAGTDTLLNFENLTGSAFNDMLAGDDSRNILDGGAGIDTLTYAAASAGVSVNLAVATLQNTGGAGLDTIRNFENLSGSAFNDTLGGDASDNVLDGGAGLDTITYARAASGVTVSLALQGAAQATGSGGNDTLINFENLTGSAFDDVLAGNAGDNAIDGGLGVDTLSYAGASAGVTVNLALTTAQDTGGAGIDTIKGIEKLVGTSFNDQLTGSWRSDTLVGGAGADRQTGGAGADLFQFVSVSDFGTGGFRDLITDFSRTQGDRIDLSGIDTNGVLEGDQAFLFVGTSAFSGVAGELRYALNAGVFSVSGDLDGDQIADFTFDVTGQGLPTLQAADFVL